MTRLNNVDPATAQGRAKEIYEGPLASKHMNIFKAMINSPAALDMFLAANAALAKGSLTEPQRQVIWLLVSQANGCDYCVRAHVGLAKKAGLTEEQTSEARRGSMTDPKLNALAQFTQAVLDTKGAVSDEQIDTFRAAGYTNADIVEVIAVISMNVFTNYFNHVNRTVNDFPPVPDI